MRFVVFKGPGLSATPYGTIALGLSSLIGAALGAVLENKMSQDDDDDSINWTTLRCVYKKKPKKK